MKNALYGSRVYLAGPMDRVSDGGVGWRQDITPFLQSMGIIVLDPCDKPTGLAVETGNYREIRQKLLQEKNFDEITKQVKEIRSIDLRMVDLADFVIVYWNVDIHMCGTLEEVFLANREKKPILIMCEQGKAEMPHWMFGTLPHKHFFDTWEDLQTHVCNVHAGEIIAGWTLFNYAKLLPLHDHYAVNN